MAPKKTGKDDAVIFIKANIDDGWHVNSQNVKDGGPIKTSFTFTSSPDYMLAGKTFEPASINHYEKVFKMDVSFFEHEVIFQQKIKLKTAQAIVKGTLEYTTCNDRQCLPPDNIEFSIPVK